MEGSWSALYFVNLANNVLSIASLNLLYVTIVSIAAGSGARIPRPVFVIP